MMECHCFDYMEKKLIHLIHLLPLPPSLLSLPLSPQTTGPCSRCVRREIATEEAHGGPGHTGERDTAQDLQEGLNELSLSLGIYM